MINTVRGDVAEEYKIMNSESFYFHYARKKEHRLKVKIFNTLLEKW